MADNQEVDNDKSSSIKNNYEENSDKIHEAGLGGKLNVDTDDEVEIIKEADQVDILFNELFCCFCFEVFSSEKAFYDHLRIQVGKCGFALKKNNPSSLLFLFLSFQNLMIRRISLWLLI